MWDLHHLFKKHARDIRQALRRRGLPEETAADLTQDTFLRVLISPPETTKTTFNPVGYLFRTARNLGIDYQRREGLIRKVDLSPEDFSAIADPSPSPEKQVYDRQKLLLTHKALHELPERTRIAFEMHRMDEMTIAAIAAELNLSTGRTWSLIREAYEYIDSRLSGL
ncbi:RNA polymerase sigma factor [Pseudochrobactrum kiredjianiae]|uniref:RNA polymerase sigma factor n=1 Tax=Pseudochrobactrum kiredjianiae TaxID=386305 RepID=A0ABW3V075_9HYPH|nr:sigma-70 family RNA polymerase sigma factor [Pseudochrobactrum kiredjianiae]MDM7852415.1 sigma-70 family RNA polymerase sigma factor [Pseudochrobactrum kiredjianiae]